MAEAEVAIGGLMSVSGFFSSEAIFKNFFVSNLHNPETEQGFKDLTATEIKFTVEDLRMENRTDVYSRNNINKKAEAAL